MTKVESRSAWTGDELQKTPFWGYALENREVADLLNALDSFKRAGCSYEQIVGAEIQKSMFPLSNNLSALFESMRDEVESGTGAILIRNLPVDQLDEQDMAIIHSGISKYIGHVVCQAGGRVRSQTRGHGRYLGKVVAEMSGSVPMQGRQSDNKFLLHTDVCDAISLLCLANAGAGSGAGDSVISSALSIYNNMLDSSPERVADLLKPVPRIWTVSNSLYCEIPIWKFYEEGRFTTQLTPVYTELSQLLPHAPSISRGTVESMNALQDIGHRIGLTFSLKPGECYFLNNHLVYHGRTAWKYTADQPSSRVMLRTWISPYGNRPLPNEPGYVELWGSIKGDCPRGRAHITTEDPSARDTMAALNARVEDMSKGGTYDYYSLFSNYDGFMAAAGRAPQ